MGAGVAAPPQNCSVREIYSPSPISEIAIRLSARCA
jgi:hypothetical protein